jgi:hypothetical protein
MLFTHMRATCHAHFILIYLIIISYLAKSTIYASSRFPLKNVIRLLIRCQPCHLHSCTPTKRNILCWFSCSCCQWTCPVQTPCIPSAKSRVHFCSGGQSIPRLLLYRKVQYHVQQYPVLEPISASWILSAPLHSHSLSHIWKLSC